MPTNSLACFYTLSGIGTGMKKLLLITMCILLSNLASADSFRCGRKVVKRGDSGNALIKKCGKPLRKFSSKETVSEKGLQSSVAVSNWVYKRSGKKDMVVSIRSGTVIKIKVE
jgi:hypothetical protein